MDPVGIFKENDENTRNRINVHDSKPDSIEEWSPGSGCTSKCNGCATLQLTNVADPVFFPDPDFDPSRIPDCEYKNTNKRERYRQIFNKN
jgi:hypothetical protein